MGSFPKLASGSAGVFIGQLDLLLDRSQKTRACIDAMASDMAAAKVARTRLLQRWKIAKQSTLGVLFAASFAHYYIASVCVEIGSLRPVAIQSNLAVKRLPQASAERFFLG
jgi:hypothetical protein